MNPRYFLLVAFDLATGPIKSAQLMRTSIGRSYYGAYNVVVEVLASCGYRVGTGAGAHKEAWRCLLATGDKDLRSAGSMLANLYEKRRRADYLLADPWPEKPVNALDAYYDARVLTTVVEAAFSVAAKRETLLPALATFAFAGWLASIGRTIRRR